LSAVTNKERPLDHDLIARQIEVLFPSLVLFAGCGIADAQSVAAAQSTVTSKSDRFAEAAALRHPGVLDHGGHEPESRGAGRAVSPKGRSV
jgi:hypothetical protein